MIVKKAHELNKGDIFVRQVWQGDNCARSLLTVIDDAHTYQNKVSGISEVKILVQVGEPELISGDMPDLMKQAYDLGRGNVIFGAEALIEVVNPLN